MSIPNNINPFLKHQALQKLIGKCPVCEYEYKTLRAKILDENEEAQLMYVKCQRCQGSLIVLLLASGPLVSSIGLITDLSMDDVQKFKHGYSIKEEDVIKIHQELKSKKFCLNFKNN